MSATSTILTGGCQCGAVRYRLKTPPREVSVCFCRMCQKAAGSYFGAFASSRIGEVEWTRGRPAIFNSSEVAERGFCRDCGTPLTFSYPSLGSLSVSAGSLDDAAAFQPSQAYGVEGRPPWFDEFCRLEGSRTEDDIAPGLPEFRSRQHPDRDT